MCGDSSRDCPVYALHMVQPSQEILYAHSVMLTGIIFFAVYVQNNFTACAEFYNLFIHVIYNFTLYIYMYVLFKTALFNLHPSSEGFYILLVNVTSEHIHLICFT